MAGAVALGVVNAFHQLGIAVSVAGRLLPLYLVPLGVILWIYFTGAVLLFGGKSAVRAHRFPLALLLFVNPVPAIFSSFADLPLQSIAAQTARGFAHWLAVPVDGDALKLMFAPQLGMFIAPGCDGMRGAVTLGYLALIVGHLYGMKRGAWALYVIGAILLAYLFNLLRLCAVVVYYWLALRITAIDGLGTQIDYAIGGTLFVCAALFLFRLPRVLRS